MSEQKYPEFPVVLIDDDESIVNVESNILEIAGITNTITCTNGKDAKKILTDIRTAIAVLDITMPEIDGFSLLSYLRNHVPEVIVIMLTGYNDAPTAVNCMKEGAFDFIFKPVDASRLITSITKAIEYARMTQESELLNASLFNRQIEKLTTFSEIITSDARIFDIFRYIEALAPSPFPVLLTGETGVGKELFARSIHLASNRKGEFICVNTAGIDSSLFSDTIFGHVEGAFTGANSTRKGFIEKAAGGTLFLDEIGDLAIDSQIKLLRVLQESTYYKLGSEVEQRSTARIITATNKSINDLQKDPSFRKDLFYRLKSHHIFIPPLRERMQDLQLLIPAFVKDAAVEYGITPPHIPMQVYDILNNYNFPGNIRELKGMVLDAVSRCEGNTLSTKPLKIAVGIGIDKNVESIDRSNKFQFPAKLPTIKEIEDALIAEALNRTKGNKKLAAEMLGISRGTINNRL